MSKPNWKYNPLRDVGIALASQEDTARETHDQRAADDLYAGDVFTLAQTFRQQYPESLALPSNASVFAAVLDHLVRRLARPMSTDLFLAGVFEDHGPQAVLMALKQAYDHPEPIVSDVVEHE